MLHGACSTVPMRRRPALISCLRRRLASANRGAAATTSSTRQNAGGIARYALGRPSSRALPPVVLSLASHGDVEHGGTSCLALSLQAELPQKLPIVSQFRQRGDLSATPTRTRARRGTTILLHQ